jgi:predicted dehydrogenase
VSVEKPRFAVVGTGAIAQVVHVPILSEREDVDLVAVSDSDPHKAASVAERFGVGQTLSSDEVLALDDLDAVVVCTPPQHHEEFAVAVLESGKHALVERPLAITSTGVERVLAAAREAGKHLMVGFPHRFRPGVAALTSFVAGGELGVPFAVRGSWLIRNVPLVRSSWRQVRAEGGGALMELGLPALDLCLGLVGYPDVARLTCHLDGGEHGVEDAAFVMARTKDGATVSVEVSNRYYSAEDRIFARVLGTEGSGQLPPLAVYKQLGGRPLEVTPRQPRPQGGEHRYMNAYRRHIDTFVRGVQSLCDISLPTEQAALMRLVEAAYRSAEDGSEVAL